MRRLICGSTVLMCCVGSAYAQSNVTLAGEVTTGLAYVNNLGSVGTWNPFAPNPGTGNAVKMLDNIAAGSHFTIRGAEDLGGGLAVTFNLTDGFKLSNGAFAPGAGGRLFGSQATVGLRDSNLGWLTLGRQYDPNQDLVTIYASDNDWAGTIGAHVGDADNFNGSYRINNSVKYMSPIWNGFQFGALYGASNQAGNFGNNRAWSVAAGYHYQSLGLGIGYLRLRNPDNASNLGGAVGQLPGQPPSTDDFSNAFTSSTLGAPVATLGILGLGGAYTFGKTTVGVTASNVIYNYQDQTRLTLNTLEANTKYMLTPALTLGAAYIYTDGKLASNGITPSARPKWNQINLGADYNLSKRTTLYLIGVVQKANGDARYAILQPPLFPVSSSSSSTVITAGIDHRF